MKEKNFKRMNYKIAFFYGLCLFASLGLSAQNKHILDLEQLISKHLDKKHIPGVMVSIVTKDSILYANGLGYADLATHEKVSGSHLFRLGSISKSFTAMGLLHAMNNSPYDLNTPIREIDQTIPFTNPWESTDPVRVKHLLEHTTGFDDFHPKAMYNRSDSTAPPVAEMVISHTNSLISRWKPGTMKAYCNPGYILAGHLTEKISGETHADYLSKNILKPIGMSSSGYYFKKPKDIAVVQGYQYQGGSNRPVDFRSIQGGPAGEFCSNAIEMAQYLQFMLSKDGSRIDSLLFTNSLFDRIENAKTTLAAKSGLTGGYGLGNFSIWKNGYLFYGHDGGIDGFSSRYVYSREADIGIAISINRQGNATEIVNLILDHLIGQQNDVNRPTYPVPKEIVDKFSGFYGFRNSKRELFRFSDRLLAGLSLDFQSDSVIVRTILGKPRYTLHYAGENQFYQGNEETPSVALFASEDGIPVLWINDSYTEMESKGWRFFSSLALILSLVIPFVFMVFAFIRIVFRFFKKRKPWIKYPQLWLASISYLLIIIGFSGALEDPYKSGILSFYTVLVYLNSLLLILFTGISVIGIYKMSLKTRAGWYYLVVTTSLAILAVFFLTNGFVGLKLWAY